MRISTSLICPIKKQHIINPLNVRGEKSASVFETLTLLERLYLGKHDHELIGAINSRSRFSPVPMDGVDEPEAKDSRSLHEKDKDSSLPKDFKSTMQRYSALTADQLTDSQKKYALSYLSKYRKILFASYLNWNHVDDEWWGRMWIGPYNPDANPLDLNLQYFDRIYLYFKSISPSFVAACAEEFLKEELRNSGFSFSKSHLSIAANTVNSLQEKISKHSKVKASEVTKEQIQDALLYLTELQNQPLLILKHFNLYKENGSFFEITATDEKEMSIKIAYSYKNIPYISWKTVSPSFVVACAESYALVKDKQSEKRESKTPSPPRTPKAAKKSSPVVTLGAISGRSSPEAISASVGSSSSSSSSTTTSTPPTAARSLLTAALAAKAGCGC